MGYVNEAPALAKQKRGEEGGERERKREEEGKDGSKE